MDRRGVGIRSMTGFARAETVHEAGAFIWELRSVNSRYLDLAIRLPEDLRAIEPDVRERVSGRLRRGKLDATLRFMPGTSRDGAIALDLELARRVIGAGQEVCTLLAEARPINPFDVLRWPGVLVAAPVDLDTLRDPAMQALDAALDDLVAGRTREGGAIRAMLLERCEAIETITVEVRERLPAVLEAVRTRLLERLAEVRDQLDPARLEQELVFLAQKTDVAEELDRLDAHVAETRRMLGEAGPVGRRLDFFMQELNREANTLGAKSTDPEVTGAGVDLKVLVEQMREQVQNLE